MDFPTLDLQAVRVRPVRPHEEPRWNALMRTRHYLGFAKLCGPQLKQVAVCGERWLALLGWQAAALHCAPRDRWIGWTPLQRRARLYLVAGNARFLLLEPPKRWPGLASRVLGLSLRRLPADWQARHGRPLWLVETFVDPTRFRGTCYRAANWVALGRTRGYGRVRGALGYRFHGQPKEVFVYPLRRRAREQLAAQHPPPAWQGRRQRLRLTTAELGQLRQCLRRLPDPRRRRGQRHAWPTLLAIVQAARLAGCVAPATISAWARRLSPTQLEHLGARRNPGSGCREAPSLNTLRRAVAALDRPAVEAATEAWLAARGSTRR